MAWYGKMRCDVDRRRGLDRSDADLGRIVAEAWTGVVGCGTDRLVGLVRKVA